MDEPSFDLTLIPADLRGRLRRAVNAHLAVPEPTRAELLLANSVLRVDDWALHTDAHGLPQLVSLPEPGLDPALGDPRGTPIAAGPDGVVRLADGRWVRLGVPGLPMDSLDVVDALDDLEQLCSRLRDALLRDQPWEVEEMPVTLRRPLGFAMLHASTESPPSASEWQAAPVILDWRLARDRWAMPVIRGWAEGIAAPPHSVEQALLWVWDAARGEVVLAHGLARLVDPARLPGRVGVSILEDAARECGRLRDALLGEDEEGLQGEQDDGEGGA